MSELLTFMDTNIHKTNIHPETQLLSLVYIHMKPKSPEQIICPYGHRQ
jgi:hypothetical protein